MIDIDWVRQQFPALQQNMVFMDNAGGSQTLKSVMNRITQYLTECDVQLGASYATSADAGGRLHEATEALAEWFNAAHMEEIVVGGSTTQLLRNLSLCISQQWQPGDEVIITNSDHEANMACWRDLQKQGIVVKTWRINPNTLQLDIDALKAMMSERTRLVAVTHASNILGTINPIQEIADTVHQHGALICVDGVAYVPHRPIDVRAWDVDFYTFSTYKTFGPHQAIMYGKLAVLEAMPGINHGFIKTVPYKLQPGNFNFELTYALPAIMDYLMDLGGSTQPAVNKRRDGLLAGYAAIAHYEEKLAGQLLDYLNDHPKVRIIGCPQADKQLRVSTISFVHRSLSSQDIVTRMDTYNIGIRYGDFYAVELIDDLGLREKEGVVRVSLVHYNTPTEVEKLIQAFEAIL
ncbi:cysteine desulfurase-like protein [Marinicella sp. W31]|uniref:cysteine desulfurase-like protein n=1 Tax=Marinicella sp. W31 TaxID=3023713 RepID=UPI0037570028